MPNKPLKLIAGMVLVLLLILGITPQIVGLSIEQSTVDSLLNMIPAEARSQVKITDQTIESSWFNSTASVSLSISPNIGPVSTELLTLQLEFDISHGPLLFTDQGMEIGLAYAKIRPILDSNMARAALSEAPFELPEITIELRTGFSQSVEINLIVDPVSYSDPEAQMSFDGLHASFAAHSNQSAEFRMTTGRFQANIPASNVEFDLSGLELSSTTQQMGDLLAPSSASLRLPSLSSQGAVDVLLTDLIIESRIQRSSAGPNQTDLHQSIAIANIESEFPLASFAWNAEINEIHDDLFDHYYQLITDLQTQIGANPGTINTDINQLSQEIGLILIQNSLVFGNTVEANAYGGDHSVEMTLAWKGLPDLTEIARLDINQAIDALDISLKISLDLEAILRSPAADFVDPYVQEGYIELDGGKILLDAFLRDGELNVNGSFIAIDQFF